MAAPVCRRDWTAVEWATRGPGVSGCGPWFLSHAASPTGSVLEPTAAVDLERPAHVRGPRRESPARVRVGKGDKPVTYEEAHAPHHVAHREGWLSLHTGNLDGEDHAAERTMKGVFVRKFMLGTFPGCLAACLKRRANQIDICALVLRLLPAHKFYFLMGYSKTLFHFYKCRVRLNLQTMPSKVVYEYISDSGLLAMNLYPAKDKCVRKG